MYVLQKRNNKKTVGKNALYMGFAATVGRSVHSGKMDII
jgi:hypothetical protein